MVSTYCNYGIYNEDTCQSAEEGDYLDELTYWDNGKKITLTDVLICEITWDELTIETEDKEEITIPIKSIEDWY